MRWLRFLFSIMCEVNVVDGYWCLLIMRVDENNFIKMIILIMKYGF